MDYIGDSNLAVYGCRGFVTSLIGDMFVDIIKLDVDAIRVVVACVTVLREELLHWHQFA